jgi:hypothetical protein
MQNALYDKGREAFLDGLISWTSMTIRAVLVDTTYYTPSLSGHMWLSDIDVSARIAISGPFDQKTITGGVADADDIVFTAVTGPLCNAVVIYRDTGTASTSRLIACITNAAGLPIVPSGHDIKLQWDSGDNRIFRL